MMCLEMDLNHPIGFSQGKKANSQTSRFSPPLPERAQISSRPEWFQCWIVPEGHLTIARRFNAGLGDNKTTSPGGTAEVMLNSVVPTGLCPVATRSRR